MKSNKKTILAIATSVVALSLAFMAFLYPEMTNALYVLGGLLVLLLVVLIWMNQKELRVAVKTRSVRYGANAAISVALVVGILAVLNYLNFNHFYRKDLTKEKIHSISDQTVKILQNLNKEVTFTAFIKPQARDKLKGLFDNYGYYSKKLKFEFVDPDRDPARAKAANIKEYGTVIISSEGKDTRVQDASEEKLTNALIKILKEKNKTICFMSGHGEKNPDQADGDGYSQVKKDLASQSYEAKTFNMLQEGKIPQECDVLLVLGPTKAFFEKEVQLISDWLDEGGRAVFALDPNIRGGADPAKELKDLLKKWHIDYKQNLIIDPTSRLLGVNASVPIVAQYSKDHPATKDFQITTLFPLASSIELLPGNPSTLKTWWLAKTTPKAFAKTDFKEIATGQVKLDERKDKMGEHQLMVAVEGSRSDKKPSKSPRIVAMSSSNVANNSYARHGANLDLFLNGISWLADDENLISIRARDEETQVPTLTQTEGRFIQLLTMVLIPGGVILLGFAIWLRRRKL